jgi:peroxiredoxin
MRSINNDEGKAAGFWTPLRIASTAVVLLLIVAGGLSSCSSSDEKSGSGSSSSTQPPKSGPGAPARNPATATIVALPANIRDAELKTVGGQTIKLADYSGKVVLVNLWATWCGPCRAETPELVKLNKEFQSRGVEMVGLSTEDPEASAESVKTFAQDFQMDYHVGWAPRDVAISFMQMTQRDAIPQSFIISRDGRIIRQFVGFSRAYPAEMRQVIEDALN